MSRHALLVQLLVVPAALAACGDDGSTPVDPETAPRATVDRFSAAEIEQVELGWAT